MDIKRIKRFRNYKLLIILQAVIGLCTISCSDDDYVYPPIVSEFIDACTGPSGTFTHILTDEGLNLPILNNLNSGGLANDSVYRSICSYAISFRDNTEGALLYSFKQIPAPAPLPAGSFSTIKTDPLKLQSMWRGGNYLNLILLVKAQNERHTFHFIEDSITTSENNGKKLYLRLFHDANDDIEAYTQKAYVSVPLKPYQSILEEGDTICFSINTTDEGWKTWKKPF